MVEVEFRVVADRRDGLMLALGQAVIACGFTLLRQRMITGAEGVVLTMRVRGPQSSLLQLEENLGSHSLVRSFEAAQSDGTSSQFALADAASAARVATSVVPQARGQTNVAPADNRRIETLLPQLARDYPRIFLHLHALMPELAAEQREPALRYIGQRVGAWVYRRDFALGGRLALADAVRHIALPAMRQVVDADVRDEVMLVANSPFCHRGHPGACCHFLCGMLAGLLGNADGSEHLQVTEARCRNTGAEFCCFEFRA